jgi:hypothetical protein
MSSAQPKGARLARLVAALAIVWAAVALVFSARMAFTFEEIEGLRLAKTAESWRLALTGTLGDGYHLLNVSWMRLLGTRGEWLLYRLPSLLSAVGSVLVLARIAFRRGAVQGLAATVLGSTGCLFLLYGGDARGYVPALFFLLACVDRLEHLLQRFRVRDVVLFNIAAVLGVLSHPSFVWAYGGVIIYGKWESWRRTRSFGRVGGELLALHLLPLATFVAVLRSRAEWSTAPTAMPQSLVALAEEAIASSLGLLSESGSYRPITVTLLVVLGFTCWRLARRGEQRWVLYVTGLVLVPVVAALLTNRAQITIASFLPCLGRGVLLLADTLGELGRTKAGAIAALAIVVVLAGLNVKQAMRATRSGRGQYYEAIKHIAQNSTGAPMTLGTDNENHARAMLWYYAPMIELAEIIRVVSPESYEKRAPEWILIESRDLVLRPQRTIQITGGQGYRFVQVYPFSTRLTGSGFGWLLYRKDPPSGAPTAAVVP